MADVQLSSLEEILTLPDDAIVWIQTAADDFYITKQNLLAAIGWSVISGNLQNLNTGDVIINIGAGKKFKGKSNSPTANSTPFEIDENGNLTVRNYIYAAMLQFAANQGITNGGGSQQFLYKTSPLRYESGMIYYASDFSADTNDRRLIDRAELMAAISSGLVPYTGATSDVNLGSNQITAFSYFSPNGVNIDETGRVVSYGTFTINDGPLSSPIAQINYSIPATGTFARTIAAANGVEVISVNGKTANPSGAVTLEASDISNIIRTIIRNVAVSSTVTGTTSETLLKTYQVNGGTFSASDVIRIPEFGVIKTGTAGNITLRIYVGSTNVFASATLIASWTTTSVYPKMARMFTLRGGNLIALSASSGSASDVGVGTSLTPTSVTINPANNMFFFTTIQLGSSSDSAYQSEFLMTN